jgi:DNA-binding transcriptional ArsR family regulator
VDIDMRELEMKAKVFRALGDPSRLAVLEALRNGPKCVSDLVAQTGLSQPNVSGHLAVLRELGLVQTERRGRFVYYALCRAELEVILSTTESLMAAQSGPRGPRREGGVARVNK